MLIHPMAVVLNTPDIQTTLCKHSDFNTLKNLSGASKAFYDKVHREFLERFFFNPSSKKNFFINKPCCSGVVFTLKYIKNYAENINNYAQMIKALSISNCNFAGFSEESEYSLKSLSHFFPNIEKLVLDNCSEKIEFCYLECFTNLKTLQLKSFRLINNSYKRNNPRLNLSFLEKLPSLKELNLYRTFYINISLQSITCQNFTFTCYNGNRYEGDFKDGVINGQGTLINSNGDRYEGNFKNGLMHGKGKLTTSYPALYASSLYEGEFRNGLKHGQGKTTCSNLDPGHCHIPGSLTGSQYEGEYKNGVMDGKGTLTYYNSDRYEGDFKDGVIHGQGTLTYSNGDRYEGAFCNGYWHGQGKYTHSNGTIDERTFNCEKLFL